MKTWVYSWIIYPLGFTIAWIVGRFHSKTRETLRLRAWKEHLGLRLNVGKAIEYWVHVASSGELEYAIPILQELGNRKKQVLLTYFSISCRDAVERVSKQYPFISLVVPLPHDGLGLMAEFVRLVRKQGVSRLLLLKYELWPGLLWECNRQGVAVFLVDAIRPSWIHKRLLHKLHGICFGYESESIDVQHSNIAVVGDSRAERVAARAEVSGQVVEQLMGTSWCRRLQSSRTLVCGSTWPEDDDVLLEGLERLRSQIDASSGILLPENILWVPHEIDRYSTGKIERKLKALGYVWNVLGQGSEVEKGSQIIWDAAGAKHRVTMVLKKGILAELYRLGSMAYVGGGFGRGIHSVWEPAVFGVPVACGPNTRSSPESRALSTAGVLTKIENPSDVCTWLRVAAKSSMKQQQRQVEELLAGHRGASKRIIDFCEGE